MPPPGPGSAPGVTIEEDNCCGCNAIAIHAWYFLDENMTAVDIVYTSCHDAGEGPGGLVHSLPTAWVPAQAAGGRRLPSVAGALAWLASLP